MEQALSIMCVAAQKEPKKVKYLPLPPPSIYFLLQPILGSPPYHANQLPPLPLPHRVSQSVHGIVIATEMLNPSDSRRLSASADLPFQVVCGGENPTV